jgi:hypothetical protein
LGTSNCGLCVNQSCRIAADCVQGIHQLTDCLKQGRHAMKVLVQKYKS